VSAARKNKIKKMLLFHLLFSTDICGLEAMLNPVYMDNVVSTTSESESGNGLVSNSGQLPSELAAQIPTVVTEDSSDIHIDPPLQHHGPLTVKHYVNLKGKDDVGYLAENPSKNADTTTQQPSEEANAVGMYTRVVQTFV
jgi:hypothetical protein